MIQNQPFSQVAELFVTIEESMQVLKPLDILFKLCNIMARWIVITVHSIKKKG
jgi:hypothetical protein